MSDNTQNTLPAYESPEFLLLRGIIPPEIGGTDSLRGIYMRPAVTEPVSPYQAPEQVNNDGITNSYTIAESPIELRRFILVRDIDITKISGTGIIAEGLQLTDKRLFMCWRTALPEGVTEQSTGLYQNETHLLAIHGHNGATRLVWID